MEIIKELISTLNMEAKVRDIRQGPFQTAVLTRYCGLASTPHDSGPHHSYTVVKDAGLLMEKDARTLSCMAESESLFEAAIGMAAINSLIEVDEEMCQNLNARDLVAEEGTGKKVAIVGHFPFIPELNKAVKKLWVIELNPGEGDLPADKAENYVPEADVVGITGTAFTNHTIEHLLKLCRPEAYVVLIGDTAPLSPVLFYYGVSAISGTRVIDPDLVIRCVSQGATYRQIEGIRKLTMLASRR